MDHLRLTHAVPASVKTANLGKWFPPWTVKCQTWNDALNPRISNYLMIVVPRWSTTIVFLQGGYRVSPNLRTFITQSEAVGRWGHDKDPVHKGSDSPRSIRQRDSDEESPRCNCKARRRAHSSPRAASSRDLPSLLYDGRPAILPVSIRMPDLVGDNVIVSVGLPSVIAPPGETASSSRKVWSGDGVLCAGPASMRDSEPVIMSEFSSDTEPDMEDELC